MTAPRWKKRLSCPIQFLRQNPLGRIGVITEWECDDEKHAQIIQFVRWEKGKLHMRLGIDGLSLLVQEALGKAPCDGSAYAFRNKRSNRIKLLWWDGTGVWLGARRLHRGRFIWPHTSEVICTLNQAQWNWLVAGVDWEKLSAQPMSHWRV
jgi:transposase